MTAPSREAELLTRVKIFKLKFNWYIEDSPAKLVIPRFIVPKLVVEDVVVDVWCVWDCKRNGHNATLWAPGFMLPTALDAEDQVIKWLDIPLGEYLECGSPIMDYTRDPSVFIKTKQGDIDVGQHFNNFRAHGCDQPSLGVRYMHTDNSPGAIERESLMGFVVYPFGNKCVPYICCQGESRILELCKGDPTDISNEFHFASCHLNLPFSVRYDPSMPRVLLLRADGELATSETTFVDDIHVAGRVKDGEFDHARDACKQLKARMNSYGNQADDRKFRQPSYWPGAWIGLIIHTNTPFPMKSCTGKTWLKFKTGLQALLVIHHSGGRFIETATLRSLAGLGVHITEIYVYGRCYLKGFFNATEAWRGARDLNGWCISDAVTAVTNLEHEGAPKDDYARGYPISTHITEELVNHATALLKIFASDVPLMIPLRPTDSHKIRYTVGDASAEGFSIATQYPDTTISFRDGLWSEAFAEGGSNLCKAQNFGNHLLHEVLASKHDGCAVWAGTDNAVWSAVWNKGMSSVKHLFNIALNLKVACQDHEVYLHIYHLSGDRMIKTGLDGRSRGDLDAGVSLGHDVRHYLPLDKGAFQLAGRFLEEWCKGWMGKAYSTPLEPVGWFWEGHQPGVHVWAPPSGSIGCTETIS